MSRSRFWTGCGAIVAFTLLLLLGSGRASAGAAGAGPRDGTWRQLPPPIVNEPVITFVDPADGRLTVLTGYSGRALKRFDLVTGGGWSEESIVGGSPTMNVSLGVVLDPTGRRLLAVGMDFSGYASGTFGEVELWQLPLDAPHRWSRLATTGLGPERRFRSALVLDPESSTLYATGGVVDFFRDTTWARIDLGDTWRIDLDGDLRWEPFPLVGDSLPGAVYGQVFFDQASARLVVSVGDDSQRGSLPSARVFALDVEGSHAWSDLAPIPSGLSPHDVAYGIHDPVDGRLLVLADAGGGSDSLRLWRFDSAGAGTWTSTDYARGDSIAYLDVRLLTLDPVGHRIVALGGLRNGGNPALPTMQRADVWLGELDAGLTWRSAYLSVSGLAVRWFAPPVFDAARQRVLAVSGYDGALFSYVPANPAWSAVATTFPRPTSNRSGALCLLDPPGDRLLLYGGGSGGFEFADLWELSFALSPPRWRRILDGDSAPAPRRDAAGVYDPLRRRIVMFGGHAGEALDETWELDLRGADPAWRRIVTRGAPPPARWGHVAVLDTRRDGMLVYGGRTGSTTASLADAWFLSFLDCDAWVPVRSDNAAPVARRAPAGFYDPIEDRFVLLGGEDASGPRFDSHALELANGSPHWADFLAQGDVPSVSAGSTALYDPAADRVLLFGRDGPLGGIVSMLSWDRVAGGPPPGLGTGTFRILGVGPNPSRGDVNIAFELPRATTVATRLYDVRGRMVRDLGTTLYQPGPHILCWDGRAVSGERLRDGVYFARIVVEGKAISGKIVLMN